MTPDEHPSDGAPRRRLRVRGAALGALAIALAVALSATGLGGTGRGSPAAARTTRAGLYVDPGSRGGRCTDARAPAAVSARRPWCTLRHAAEAAAPGSTILLRDGRYPALSLDSYHPRAPVTFRAAPGEHPVVAGMDLRHVEHLRFAGLRMTAQTDLTDVGDVTFTGIRVGLVARGARTQSAFVAQAARGVTWRGCVVEDALNGVQVVGPPSSGIAVRDTRFARIGNAGVVVDDISGVTIDHDEFADVRARADMVPTAHSDAIHVVGPARLVRITRNLVHGGRGVLLQFDPSAARRAGAAITGVTIAGNVFTGPDFAIRVLSVVGLLIEHNTVWGPADTPGTGVDLRTRWGANAPTSDVTLLANLIRRLAIAPGVGLAEERGNLVSVGAGSPAQVLHGTPRFIAPERSDYALAGGSPGAAAGVGAPALSPLSR